MKIADPVEIDTSRRDWHRCFCIFLGTVGLRLKLGRVDHRSVFPRDSDDLSVESEFAHRTDDNATTLALYRCIITKMIGIYDRG